MSLPGSIGSTREASASAAHVPLGARRGDFARRAPHRQARAALALATLLLGACGDSSEGGDKGPAGAGAGTGSGAGAGAPNGGALPATGAPSQADADLIRARAEALHVDLRYKEAAALLAPLVTRTDAAAEDLVRAGILALVLNDLPAAAGFADRALKAAPLDLAANFLRGNVHLAVQEYPQAEACFRKVIEGDATDDAARVQLAETLVNDGKEDEAEALWRQVQAHGPDANLALYRNVIFRLSRVLIMAGRTDEGMALNAERDRLAVKPLRKSDPPPKDPEVSTQGYGRFLPPKVRGSQAVAHAPRWPAFTGDLAVDLHGATHVLARDLDRDGRTDLVGWGPAGLVVALQQTAGAFSVQLVHARPVLTVVAGDLGTGDAGDPQQPDEPRRELFHPALELLTVEATEAGTDRGTWSLYALDDVGRYQSAGPDGLQGADARDAILCDFDHDGDLDIVVAADSGLHVARNDGFTSKRMVSFPDASCDAGRALRDARAVLAEDFDGDNDVDWLVVTGHGLALLSNDRRERFSDVTAAWNVPQGELAAAAAGGDCPVDALDLDEDGRADLVLQAPDGTLRWARNEPPSGGAHATGAHFAAPVPLRADKALAVHAFADLDLDGHVDLLARRTDGVAAGLGLASRGAAGADAAGAAAAAALTLLDGARAPGLAGSPDAAPQPFAVADMDGDERPDLVLLAGGSAHVLSCAGPVGHALPLQLDGLRDNDEGLGTIVELRAGSLYRRIDWRGPEVLGLGEQQTADVLRLSWPNGVLQHAQDLQAGAPVRIEQANRLIGSCPFLYTWNGSTYEFITDVLGTTPLGLPMDDAQFVPFDHDEYVKIRGDQLLPRDGRLQLALTEELREVTYLDRAVLHAIDHPTDVEIQPNEHFSFPPFPPPHVHTLATIVPPARALASDGSDVTAQIAAVDDDCARPFRRLPTQLDGLAQPWWLDLTLAETPEQRAALAGAKTIRLALTGWLQWGNASVNLVAARSQGIAFEPPMLWVPDGAGWKPAGDPVGFPAGKTKCMVLDITDIVKRDDPRLRITTTLQLSWDAIRIVLDDDDAPFTDTPLEPSAALLHYRGFSWPLDTADNTRPERFDWDDHAQPRWNQHPGRYTRYGSVLPLLGAIDDEYVILGSGDCVRLEFDAAGLPPLPAGWSRDWLLFLDGWAKDRDPNTASAERVEPLPFHAMTAYPPPAGESFPDDAAHRAWAAAWNTREGAVLLPPLDLASAPDGPRLDATLRAVR